MTRDRLHPGRLLTGCGGEVLETATVCPLCGKPVESDPFKRLEDEYDALEASYRRLHARYCEIVTEVHRLRDFREAVEGLWSRGSLHVMPASSLNRMEKELERRKREVQTLQEACRKHREARRDYGRDLKWRNDQIGAQNKVIASLRGSIGDTRLNVREAWRPAPPGVMGAYLECATCGGPFEWSGFAVPSYCPHCGRNVENAWTRLNEPTPEPDDDQTGGESFFCDACEADPNVPPSHSTLYDGKLKRPGVCLNCGREIDIRRYPARKEPRKGSKDL